jgi:hypothetical protein
MLASIAAFTSGKTASTEKKNTVASSASKTSLTTMASYFARCRDVHATDKSP